ncbi:hypothetical protein LJC52_01100 [Bacteroidales bacterium OttesenSCG-928-A17]|nr:hypothetical protein [Bacteroidales bacterium OttesenSCG-928-A17]
MKKRLLFLIIIFFHVVGFGVHAQSDSTASEQLQQFVQNIQVFNRLVPQEKVYLHFDNTSYVLGDIIWFKAYVVNACDFRPDTLSRVLYVELLNEKGKLLETKKLKIENGQCHGEFKLDDTNIEHFAGFYEVRAYTKFMLNFGEETVFSRVFPVFNEFKANGQYTEEDIKPDLHINEDINQEISLPDLRPKKDKKDKVNVDFYPEGGNLITGLNSRVAFRITDDKGQPLDAAGNVINTKEEVLSDFSTQHAGMGFFFYIPDGKKNRVKINHNNKDYSFDLPTSKKDGYVMKVQHIAQDAIIIQIEKTPQTAKALLGLSILCKGNILFFQEIELEENPYVLTIPYEALGTGVHQITLFDSKGEIFSERLAFILQQEYEPLRLEVVTNKKSYEPEDLIQIDFSIAGKYPVDTTVFSLAVRDEETMVHTHSGNIYTHLLLSSDLKGFIENPEEYFSPDNPNLQTFKLDLLMMVQGWRRYEWQTMAGVKPFKPLFNLEKQLIIKGHITSSKGKEIEVIARMKDENNEFRMDGEAKTDKNGEFYFFPVDFYGTWSLNLYSLGLSDVNKRIRLDRWFSPTLNSYNYSETKWINNNSIQKNEGINSAFTKESTDSNDSIAWGFRIQTVDVTTNQRKKKIKEFVHQVGMEIDRAIDKGEKFPKNVHDYLTKYDKQYSFGEVAGSGKEEIITSPSSAEIDRRTHFDMKKVTYLSDGTGVDCDGRDIYQQDGNLMSYFYGRPFVAKFFHLLKGKLEVYDRMNFQTGERAYDIQVKELTYNRFIHEVEKIIISGERLQDCTNKSFTPIYIFPYEDFSMRWVKGTRYTTFDGYSAPADYFKDRIVDGIYRPAKIYHRTLYWNPNVKTDEQGKVSIQFYNNDFCEKINISAEGITTSGIPVVQ